MKTTKTMVLLWTLFLCTAAMAAEKKEITVKLTVPDSAWTLTIDEIYKGKGEIWVISRLARAPGVMGLQVISMRQDTVKVSAPDLPVKHFVIGKTWNWKNKEPYIFIKNLKQIEKNLKLSKLLYKKAKKKYKIKTQTSKKSTNSTEKPLRSPATLCRG